MIIRNPWPPMLLLAMMIMTLYLISCTATEEFDNLPESAATLSAGSAAGSLSAAKDVQANAKSKNSDYGEYYEDYCPDHSDPTASEDMTLFYFEETDDPKSRGGLLPGDIEAVHFKNDHPFHLRQIRIYFRGPGGPVMIRVHADHCRSWPATYTDLIDPIYRVVEEDAGWITIDLPEPGIFIMPHERFWIAYWHYFAAPYLGRQGKDPNENYRMRNRFYSRVWADNNAPFVWGVSYGNYLVEAVGSYFCKVEQPLFTDVTEDAFDGETVDEMHYQRVNWADVNGDTWQDVLFTMDGLADTYGLFVNDADGTFTNTTQDAGLNQEFHGNLALFGDVDNNGAPDLMVGVYVNDAEDPAYPWRSTMLLNDGTGTFTEVSGSGLELNEGTFAAAAFADYDGDGCLDLYMGDWLIEYPYSTSHPDWLMKGNCDGTFTDVSDASLLRDASNTPVYGVLWMDYDNDGDQDIFVSSYGRVVNRLFENQGDGTFINVAPDKGLNYAETGPGNTMGSDCADMNNDGYLDCYLAEISHPRYQPHSDPSSLNVNQGPPDYIYENIIEEAGIACDEGELDPVFIDWDNDGRMDLFVSDLYTDHYCRLFRQMDDGTFEDYTYLAGIDVHDCTNNAWADYDKDGDVDLMTTQRADGFHVFLYRNEVGQDHNWVSIRLTGDGTNKDGIGARVTVTAGSLTQVREIKGGRGHHSSQDAMVAAFGLGDETTITEVKVKWSGGSEETWTGVNINSFVHLIEGDTTVNYDS